MGRGALKEAGDHEPALAVGLELIRAGPQFIFTAVENIGKARALHHLAQGFRHLLSAVFLQLRLVVKGIHRGRAAHHEKEDNALGFGSDVRQPRQHGARGINLHRRHRRGLRLHRVQRQRAKPAPELGEKTAAAGGGIHAGQNAAGTPWFSPFAGQGGFACLYSAAAAPAPRLTPESRRECARHSRGTPRFPSHTVPSGRRRLPG